MSTMGKDLVNALKEAKKKGLVTLQTSPEVGKLRKKLKLSQREFSAIYRINIETLRKWEQGQRDPDSVSRAYLKCIQYNPKLISELVNK
ncbi:MAG TPA: type II toxin-antitoxin system MqsA family antitoxin [Gammaproteobacteria bacterium]|nr:type II toxin-antitoxin system MqsA family antitoxin [Gammaproteobacteria bacterium]